MIEEKDIKSIEEIEAFIKEQVYENVKSIEKIEGFIKKQGYSINFSTFNKKPDGGRIEVTVTVEFGTKIHIPPLSSRLMFRGRPAEEKAPVRKSRSKAR